MLNKSSCKKGFTLIELLVVVLIIGILASIAVPQYRRSVWKAKAANMLALARKMVQAEEMYKLANGDITSELSALDIGFDSLPEKTGCYGWAGFHGEEDSCRRNDDFEVGLVKYISRWFVHARIRRGPYSGLYVIYTFSDTSFIGVPGRTFACQGGRDQTDKCKEIFSTTGRGGAGYYGDPVYLL